MRIFSERIHNWYFLNINLRIAHLKDWWRWIGHQKVVCLRCNFALMADKVDQHDSEECDNNRNFLEVARAEGYFKSSGQV